MHLVPRAAIAATAAAAIALVGLGLGAAPAQAGTTTGNLVYLASMSPYGITGYNPATGTTVMNVPLSGEPYGVALAPGGATLYATELAPNGSNPGSLVVINTATGTIKATIPVGSIPQGLAVSPSGNTVYVANSADGTVSVINTVTDTVTATIPVGGLPTWITISPNGNSVYVPTFTGGAVDVISAASNTVTSTFSDGMEWPEDAVFSPDGTLIYIADPQADDVAVISAATDQLLDTIPVEIGPGTMAISPNGNSLYVANQASGTVSTINAVADTVTSTVGIGAAPDVAYGGGPLGITTSADGSTVYVTTPSGPASVYAINAGTGAVTAFNDGSVASGIATLPLPQVTGVSPNGDGTAGGNQVTVTGTGFTGASAVDFGGVTAPAYTVNSPTSITATVPPGTAGNVDVTVAGVAGTSLTGTSNLYAYQIAPDITGVGSIDVPATGGYATVTGTGLNGPVTVTFGSGSTKSFFNSSATSLTVAAPAGKDDSTLTLTVTNSVGTSNTAAFRYISPLKPINPVQTQTIHDQA
jgi:YVTN family beta-propeller protein